MRVLYITLGCAKNEVDTDRMRALLSAAGFEEAYEVADADVAIVNTCSFLASATSESIECTLTLAEEIAQGVRSVPIVMCGCVPSRYEGEIESELPEVAAFVRHDREDEIVDVVRQVLGEDGARQSAPGVLRTVEGASAFLKISEGCDRFCSFCAIPYIRGRYYSRPLDVLLEEARSLLDGGVREIVLIGQDTGIWGSDFDDPSSLADLLEAMDVVAAPYGAWIRVLYLQPEGMTDELVAAIRDLPSVLPYIDIPIQHCSARVLRAMNRKGSVEEYHALFERLRGEIPGMVLRSTAMAGFPGETDDEFEELVGFLESEGLDYCSVFSFSPEDGTYAAKLPDQIPEDVKLERTQRLLDIAEQSGFSATSSHVGEVCRVIIDGIEQNDDGYDLIGHAWFQAPDSDGVVHIEEGEAAVGDIVTVELVDSFCYEMIGRIVEEV